MDAGPGHDAGRGLFHVRYTLRGTSYLLHRMGFSPHVPAPRAAERDETAIAAWRTGTWVKVRGDHLHTGDRLVSPTPTRSA
jgi:hypothetical protein